MANWMPCAETVAVYNKTATSTAADEVIFIIFIYLNI